MPRKQPDPDLKKTCPQIIARLKTHANPANVAGMARYGINPRNTLGVTMPIIKTIAKEQGRDHSLALQLWNTGIREARLLAAFIDEPEKVTPEQMEQWAADFDSWDICDGVCCHLFRRTPHHARAKAVEWAAREETFVKRAGFTLMATLTVHDKKATNQQFAEWLPIIQRESLDERNFVRKAVNWALRQIGKQNLELNKQAIQTARQIQKLDTKSARWIANDALRELTSDAVQNRLKKNL